MSYRIMHITGGYPDFLRRILEGIPEGKRTSDRMLRGFVDSRVGWSDFWVQGLRGCGHEATMVVGNFEALQKAWAAEHGLSYEAANWVPQILLGQLKAWQPDVVLIQDLYFVSAELRRAMRDLLPNAVLLGWRFAPTRDMEPLRDLDVLITGADAYAAEYRKSGIRAEVVPLFFPETIAHQVQQARVRARPFVFSGTIGEAGGWHSLRYRTIEELLRRTPLEVFTGKSAAGSLNPWWGSLAGAWSPALKRKLPRWLRRKIPLQSIYSGRFHDSVFGLDYFRLLADTQICFNAHIDMATGFAGNMRLFEATGMGACLLTDWKPNLAEFFEPDREVVAYRSPGEAAEKANYLLAHPRERESIAEGGRRRALRDHTLTARMGRMDGIIERAVQRRSSSRMTVCPDCSVPEGHATKSRRRCAIENRGVQ